MSSSRRVCDVTPVSLPASLCSDGGFRLIVKSRQGVKNEEKSRMIYARLLCFVSVLNISPAARHALPDYFIYLFMYFSIHQGLPGPTGLKGDRGDGGIPVRAAFLRNDDVRRRTSYICLSLTIIHVAALFPNRGHVGCQVLQGSTESEEKQ